MPLEDRWHALSTPATQVSDEHVRPELDLLLEQNQPTRFAISVARSELDHELAHRHTVHDRWPCRDVEDAVDELAVRVVVMAPRAPGRCARAPIETGARRSRCDRRCRSR